jgi:hypothetical protein
VVAENNRMETDSVERCREFEILFWTADNTEVTALAFVYIDQDIVRG